MIFLHLTHASGQEARVPATALRHYLARGWHLPGDVEPEAVAEPEPVEPDEPSPVPEDERKGRRNRNVTDVAE